MILLHRLRSLMRWLFRRNDVERDLARELESFVQMSSADRIEKGEIPRDARRNAQMELRGVEQTKERVRAERWGVQLDRLRQDLHYGWRSLARQPGFSAIVILTLTATPVGINAENILTARLGIPPGSTNLDGITNFFSQLEDRVAAQPGVVSAALSSCHPLAGRCASTIIWFRDRPEVPRGTEPPIGVHRVSESYFATMKIPLIRGRLFNNADWRDAQKVVVISETAAQRYFPGEDPLGKPVGIGINGFGDRAEVIGIVGNVRYRQIEEPPQPDAYVSLVQGPQTNLYCSRAPQVIRSRSSLR